MASKSSSNLDGGRINGGHRRKGHSPRDIDDDGSEEEYKEELMPKWKLYLVGASIFMCFALLYPSVFSPMVNSLLGRGGANNQQSTVDRRQLHEPPLGRPGPSPEGERGGFKPHVHPASMRMPQAVDPPQGGGRGGGTFTWLLPFYTVGVIGFLLYTLFKIMFKPKGDKRQKSRARKADYWDAEGSEEEFELDDRSSRSVQTRLLKTESAMRKILEQLEEIASTTNMKTEDTGLAPRSANKDTAHENMTQEQVKAMEKGLRELRALSELCKRQKAEALGECATASVSSGDDSDAGHGDADEQQASDDEHEVDTALFRTGSALDETAPVDEPAEKDTTREPVTSGEISHEENQTEVEGKPNGAGIRLEDDDVEQVEVSTKAKARRRRHRRER